MFNVGGGEILVILVVALVVLGPDKLPGAMRTIGQAIAEVRKLSNGFQSEMRNAMYADERPTVGPIVAASSPAPEASAERPDVAPAEPADDAPAPSAPDQPRLPE